MDRARTWPALEIAPTPDPPDLLQAALSDYDIVSIDESLADRWRVFFGSGAERDRARPGLSAAFPELSLASVDVPDEDWAARSQASLKAIRVGQIIVAPPWDAPLTIVIKPSMGFGTGHHATTRLCLDALQHCDVSDRIALDLGTGSGVLAIAASLLGAAEVTGVDDDPDAIQAAWENLALNTGAIVSLLVGDFRSMELNASDIVLANITGGALMAAADRIKKLVSPRGRLILSGFLTHEEADVLARYEAFSVQRRGEEEGWACVTMRKTEVRE